MKRSESANLRTNSGSSSLVAVQRCLPHLRRPVPLRHHVILSANNNALIDRGEGYHSIVCCPPCRDHLCHMPPQWPWKRRAARAVTDRRCADLSASRTTTQPLPMSDEECLVAVLVHRPSTKGISVMSMKSVTVYVVHSSALGHPLKPKRTSTITNRSSPPLHHGLVNEQPPLSARAPQIARLPTYRRNHAAQHVPNRRACLNVVYLEYISSV